MTDVDTQGSGPDTTKAETATASIAPERPARPKTEPATTLLEYLSGRTGATAFLKNLRDGDIWRFQEQDCGAALEGHRELDPHFTKTASLLARALKAKDDRHVLPISDFARLA